MGNRGLFVRHFFRVKTGRDLGGEVEKPGLGGEHLHGPGESDAPSEVRSHDQDRGLVGHGRTAANSHGGVESPQNSPGTTAVEETLERLRPHFLHYLRRSTDPYVCGRPVVQADFKRCRDQGCSFSHVAENLGVCVVAGKRRSQGSTDPSAACPDRNYRQCLCYGLQRQAARDLAETPGKARHLIIC